MATPLKAGGILIFRRMKNEVQYLLLQTSYGEHHWTPPKGHVDPGEDFRTAALRETEEEAGLRESQFRLFDFEKCLKYSVRGRAKEVVYWLAELKDPNTPVKLSDEHQDFKWLCLSEACSYSRFNDMQEVLKDADEYIQGRG
ncbi:putative bis(5'-nucleosyl)-tetraphosphatase [Apostichopus japonicus]|uniref:Bis(5'-nucleosyl)-tetraphosphatase [asymmetrical] n=1 Tax=Stichopus japonicus TaxID=307972 RepID=A0A2G8LGU8_STIJA|nr:putative bis(5'-nucleosyl)-tetraphosphatase [Apostichopus japonicus]